MKEPLTKKQMNWLREAGLKWEANGLIEPNVRMAIEEQYVQKAQMTGLQLLLIIGGLLLALGLLTLVTTSWFSLDVWIKGLILAVTVAVFTGFGDVLEKNYPKTASGFYMVSLLVYSIGILLINEISGARWNPYSLYPLWLLGVALFLWVKQMPEILGLTSLLSGVLVTIEMMDGNPLEGIQIIGYALAISLPVFMVFWNSIKWRLPWLSNLNGTLFFISILSITEILDFDVIIGFLICFGVGFLLTYGTRVIPKLLLSKWVGLNAIGVFGLLLSFEEFWVGYFYDFDFGALLILLITGVFFIKQLKEATWIAGVWLIIFVMRLYFDTLFDVLPKGLFFIVGGLCLLISGFLLERFRKGKLGAHYED